MVLFENCEDIAIGLKCKNETKKKGLTQGKA